MSARMLSAAAMSTVVAGGRQAYRDCAPRKVGSQGDAGTVPGLGARLYIKDNRITEGMLIWVEVAVRCYDPCLSCSTHALGRMPVLLQLVSPTGEVLDEKRTD